MKKSSSCDPGLTTRLSCGADVEDDDDNGEEEDDDN